MTPEMDYTAARFWMDVLQSAGVILLGIYTWWVNREKVTSSRFTALETRLTKVEASGGCSQHAELDVRVRQVEVVVGRIDGRMEGVGNALDNIQNFLMEKGPR